MAFSDPANSGNPDLWYFATNGVRAGPFSRDQIEQMWSVGAVSTESLVWTVGMPDWLPAYEIFGMGDEGPAAEQAGPQLIPLAGPAGEGAPATFPIATAGMLNYHRMSARPMLRPAGFWRRFLAWLIDWIIYLVIYFCILVPAITATLVHFGWLVPTVTTIRSSSGSSTSVMTNIAYSRNSTSYIGWAMFYSYFALMEAGPWQATLGKRAVGIRVGDIAGRRLPLVRSFVRQLASLLNFLTLGLTYLLVATTAEKTSIHDLLTDSRVVCGRAGTGDD